MPRNVGRKPNATSGRKQAKKQVASVYIGRTAASVKLEQRGEFAVRPKHWDN